MIINWRCSWGERETLLEGTGRMQNRVVMNIEGVKVEWNVRVGVGVHRKRLLSCMVEGVFTQSGIPVRVVGYHNTIRGIYLGRKLGRSFSRLCPMW